MTDALLFDTDILIDFLRTQPEAVNYFKKIAGDLTVSAVTVAELYGGVRKGREKEELDRFFFDTQRDRRELEYCHAGRAHSQGLFQEPWRWIERRNNRRDGRDRRSESCHA